MIGTLLKAVLSIVVVLFALTLSLVMLSKTSAKIDFKELDKDPVEEKKDLEAKNLNE